MMEGKQVAHAQQHYCTPPLRTRIGWYGALCEDGGLGERKEWLIVLESRSPRMGACLGLKELIHDLTFNLQLYITTYKWTWSF